MNRKLIVCCDGLWREPSSSQPLEHIAQQALEQAYTTGRKSSLLTGHNSNVLKFTYALNPKHSPEHDGTSLNVNNAVNSNTANKTINSKSAENRQLIYYHPGNKTQSLIKRWFTSHLGSHIHEQILLSYQFLMTNYRQGDEIFLLGASQGAYSVRSLADLISTIGILKAEDLPYLDEAYQYYRTPIERRGHGKFYHVHQLAQHAQEANRTPYIQFLGVWDTVGGQGAPTPVFHSASQWQHIGFHSTELSHQVENAYQALALDETQSLFSPDLWTDKPETAHVKQVWFSGSHLDVCGGNLNTGLSDISLQWMIEQAQKHGLSFDLDYLSQICQPNLETPIHNSETRLDKTLGQAGLHSPHIRLPKTPSFGMQYNQKGIEESVHPSVQLRLASKLVESPDITESQISQLPLSETEVNMNTTAKNKESERRHKRRTPLKNESGLLHVNGKTHACLLLDITQGQGLRIQSALEIPKGSDITIDGTEIGPLYGKVVWHRGTQTGISLAA